MATLKSNGLALDIVFDSYEDEWINYNFKFLWKDEIIINDSILKRHPEGWMRRPYGTFIADDYQDDDLIATIKTAIETNECKCWEPMEPDAKVAIYPGRFFPFVETRYNFYKELEELRKEKEKTKSPDDLFTIITFIDEYNFKDSGAYAGDGISLHMIVKRKDLEEFVRELQTEYTNLMKNR